MKNEKKKAVVKWEKLLVTSTFLSIPMSEFLNVSQHPKHTNLLDNRFM